MREALRVLESNGVVRSRPGDPNGPEILPFTSGGLSKQMRRLARAEGLSLSDLLVSRMMLDSTSNRLAATLRTTEQLAEMEAAIDQMREAVEGGYASFSEADFAFHETIARASGNTLIQVSNEVVRDTVLSLISDKIAHARNARALMKRSLHHHELVLEAIRAGDGPAAANASLHSLYDYYSGYVPPPSARPSRRSSRPEAGWWGRTAGRTRMPLTRVSGIPPRHGARGDGGVSARP